MSKRLYRSRKDKILGGVAGGLGEYLEIDPVLVRILFVVATIAGGFGLLAYLACWIIVPESRESSSVNDAKPNSAEPATPQSSSEVPSKKAGGGLIGGLVLIVLGMLFLADNFLPYFHFWEMWPLILVVIGGAMLWKAIKSS